MKGFRDILSRLSWLVFAAGFLPIFLLVFRPSAKEFLMMMGVDYVATLIAYAVDARLFLRLYPDSRAYFQKQLDIDALGSLPHAQRLEVFRSLLLFPSRRAKYSLLLSVVKVLPGIAVILFVWDSPMPDLTQLLLVVAAEFLLFSYFYGAVFIESHAIVSRTLAETHRRHDWAEVFSGCRLPYSRGEFENKERLAMATTWVSMLWLEATLVLTWSGESRMELVVGVLAVNLVGIMLSLRMWYLSTRFLVGGLETLFQAFEVFEPTKTRSTLALHSSPLLARFETIVNELTYRLRSYERELSQWIFKQAEQSRYRALGEISALVVHDLSGPLTVVQFCSEGIASDPELAKDGKYLDHLLTSSRRSLELITSLKASLKDQAGEGGTASVAETVAHARRLLQTQFHSKGFSRIRFEAEPELEPLQLAVTRPDLTHILMNILANSVANLLDHPIPEPRIDLGVESREEGWVTLLVRDNGTGLESAEFEKLTTFAFQEAGAGQAQRGLGLRLVRRLVERYGGDLCVVEYDRPGRGTRFRLKLPVAAQDSGAETGSAGEPREEMAREVI
jgi:signal transduction histidine kinase